MDSQEVIVAATLFRGRMALCWARQR